MSRLLTHATDAASLADELARLRIIDPERLAELLADFPGGGSVALADYFVSRGTLTPFQAQRILVGEAGLLSLGSYRLTAPAGPGTFGAVYSATRVDRPREKYRVRVFPLRSLWRARQAKQLARTLSNSPHPWVVPPVDVDSANGYHYIVWPHAEGVSLADRVARPDPLPVWEAVGLLAHLADTLHACHARGVAHGAVTPLSVVLAPDGLPRLLELGAGAVLSANLMDGDSLLDTMTTADAASTVLEYAAPEFATDPTPGALTDQYALGAVGYFALSGVAPFSTLRLADQLVAKAGGTPEPLDRVNAKVSEELAGVIDRMLAPNPGDRFAGLDEVHERLAAIAAQSVPASQLRQHAGGPETEPEPEYLPLSTLRDPVKSSGTVSWAPPGSDVSGFAPRDDSEASVNFELPDLLLDARDLEPAGLASTSLAMRAPAAPAGLLDPVPARPPVRPDAPTSPARCTSPGSDAPVMAKTPPQPMPDPRRGVVAPVHYHTEDAESHGDSAGDSQEPRLAESVLWRKLKRNLLFWQSATDVIQVSVFAPATLTPGQSAKLSVYLHTPDAAESIRTLSRAFHHDAEVIGTGHLAKEVARQTQLAVHLSVTNAGVSKSLLKFVWRGQPHRVMFELHVPWEAPSGAAPGLVSVGVDNLRIGKIPFHLNLLPRKV